MKNHSRLLLKIILPAIICFTGTIIFKKNLDIYPVLFALTIGIINWDNHKLKPLYGIIISIIFCYLAYGLGILSLGIYKPIEELLNNNINFVIGGDRIILLGFIFSAFILSPIITFFVYKFIFIIPKTKQTLWIIIVSIAILVIQSYLFFDNDYNFPVNSKDVSGISAFMIWQLIMALSLQLIIYQKELRDLLRFKK